MANFSRSSNISNTIAIVLVIKPLHCVNARYIPPTTSLPQVSQSLSSAVCLPPWNFSCLTLYALAYFPLYLGFTPFVAASHCFFPTLSLSISLLKFSLSLSVSHHYLSFSYVCLIISLLSFTVILAFSAFSLPLYLCSFALLPLFVCVCVSVSPDLFPDLPCCRHP